MLVRDMIIYQNSYAQKRSLFNDVLQSSKE